MANVGAKSSKQNQSNINESQRDVVKKPKPKDYNPQLNLKRLIAKNSLKNGLKIKRRLF